jgi:multidrug efflux pump subunit AcrB
MLNLTSFALRNSRLVIIGVVGVIVIGLMTYLSYPRKEDPTVRVREGIVTAYFPGMAPERIENLITRPLEEKIREIPEVKDIRSDSKTGVVVLHIEMADEYDDLQPIWQSLRNKMIDIRSDLPQGTIGPIVNDEVGITAVATIALWSDGFSLREMRDAARDVRNELYSLRGIKKIEIYGDQPERIYMEVSNAKLAEYGVNPMIIVDTLQKQNVILPGGTVTAAGVDIVIEPSGNFSSVRDIEDVVFAVPSTGQTARVGDLVKVTRAYRDPAAKPVYFNGKQAIIISVSITDGTNSVEFGGRLTARLRDLIKELPIGYVLEYATYQPDLVEAAVSDAVGNVYQTLIIVLIVVMLFLGTRTGAIVGTIVPLSMLLALIIMRQLQIDLQRV